MNEELQLLNKFEKNDIWFRNNYKNLQAGYANEYVAVKEGRIIGHDKNPKTLIRRLEGKKEDLAVILIQFIPEKGLQILY